MKKKLNNIFPVLYRKSKDKNDFDFLGQRTVFNSNLMKRTAFVARHYYNRKYFYANHYEHHPYPRVNNFKPGDTVYLIVHNKNNTTKKIVKTKLVEMHQFSTKKYLANNKWSEFWFDDTIAQTTGLPVQNVFKTYNEAKFYLHY